MTIFNKRIRFRNVVLIIFLVFTIFFVIEIFAPQADAKPSVITPKATQLDETRNRRPPSTTSTTTTTTIPPTTIKKKTAASPAAPPVTQPPASWPGYPGTPQDWMREAGIPESDWPQAELLVSREGGWRPCVRNGGVIDCAYTGPKAYGIPQSLPGSKMAAFGADWQTNPVTQLKWMKSYVEGRYGTWANANRMWESRSPHWY